MAGAARVLVCLGWLTISALPHIAGPRKAAQAQGLGPKVGGEVLASVALLLGAERRQARQTARRRESSKRCETATRAGATTM